MSITKDRNEVADEAEAIYQRVRSRVETPENIGKMMVIDVHSEDFEIDPVGVIASRRLRDRHPEGRFFGIRIGYQAAVAFGGMMKRREV